MLTPEDMGVVWRGLHPFVAMALEEERARRRADGTFYRRRIAWAASQDAVHIARCVRPLLPQADGRLSYSAGWSDPKFEILEAGETPTRRVGDVPCDPVTAPTVGPQPPSSTAASGSGGSGEVAASYLPRAVREGVLRRANPPVLFEGEAVLYTRGDGSRYWTVRVLKHSVTEAVVVLGSRQEGASTWQVEQVRYPLRREESLPVGRLPSKPGLPRG